MAVFDWVLDPQKCLAEEEVTRLRRTLRRLAHLAAASGQRVPVRDRFVVELALATGLRVMEIAGLNCGDVFAAGEDAWLAVRKGKGGKKRIVRFSHAFGKTYLQYLRWKQAVGEATCHGSPLLVSSNTGRHLTTRALQKAFKRSAAKAGLPRRYSIHCLRHTYACALYKASGYNLRLVQKQLGHARIATTQVYADVMDTDVRKALYRLYQSTGNDRGF